MGSFFLLQPTEVELGLQVGVEFDNSSLNIIGCHSFPMMAKGLFVFDFGLLFSMKVVTKLFRFYFQYFKFSLTSLVKVN